MSGVYTRTWRFLVFLSVTCLLFSYHWLSQTSEVYHHPGSAEVAPEPDKDQPLKTILFWNKWYSKEYYDFGKDRDPFLRYGCKESRCRTTADVSELNTSDAVVVCGRLLDWTRDPLVPPRASPDQVFVYFNREAPVKTLGKTRQLNGIFNATMTYRWDSTIPYAYSEIVPRQDNSGYRPLTLEDIKHKSKTNLVSWMVSRCNKPGSVRHEYAAELGRHLTVDVYGRCGNLTCDRYDTGECNSYQERTYKFYLALENTVCDGYITEKAFRTLRFNMVPIVMGGRNYTQLLPPHSFIDVKDFRDPGELAKYLRHLGENDEEYLRYFDWKEHYEVRDITPYEPFCKLCELLHDKNHRFQQDFDLERWWDHGGGEACVTNRNLSYLYDYFNIPPPAIPRRRGRGLQLKEARKLLKQEEEE